MYGNVRILSFNGLRPFFHAESRSLVCDELLGEDGLLAAARAQTMDATMSVKFLVVASCGYMVVHFYSARLGSRARLAFPCLPMTHGVTGSWANCAELGPGCCFWVGLSI